MKQIQIEGEAFFYELYSHTSEYSGAETRWTKFYTKGIVRRKKYYFFGPLIEEDKYFIVFRMDGWITDAAYSKEEMRAKVTEAYNKYLRWMEIERGEII